MGDELRFLKESELFKGMPEPLLVRIYDEGLMRRYGPGEFIFREGDSSFEMYVIRQGVVEVRKNRETGHAPTIVAYLSPGECFGEMALINGRPRSASVRVPQEAEVLQIVAESYEALLQQDILFLRRLCEILAFRLETADTKIAGARVLKELQGSLCYFDLATVMQTLINSGQSGVMFIESPDGIRAEIVFRQGRILTARMGHLAGEDAFYQLFQAEMTGEFIFKGEAGEQQDEITALIGKTPMNLLLEAMRMKDETHVLLAEIQDFNRVFTPCRNTLLWTDGDTLDTAVMIWMKVSEGVPLSEIVQSVPRCSYTVLEIVKTMLSEGLIR